MKKTLRIILLLMVSAFIVSMLGCRSEYVEPDYYIYDYTYKVEPKGKIKVSMYLRSGEASEVALDNWIEVYNKKYPDVTVKKDIIEWAQFPLQIAAGTIGDVYYSADLDVYKYVVKSKAGVSLDAYIDVLDIDIQNIFTGIYELGCVNGRLYMVPSDITQTTVCVNKTALSQAGLSMPDNSWTWEDFVGYCKKLTVMEDDGTLSRTGTFIHTGNEFVLLPYFLSGWGGNWCDTVNKKINLVSDENVLKGFEQLINLIRDGYCATNGLTGELGAKYGNLVVQSAGNLTNTAGYGFIFNLLWQSRVQLMEWYQAMGLDADFVTVPKTPVRNVPGEGFGYIVYSKTKNPDAAATFALTLLTDEGQNAFNNIIGGGIPCTKHQIEKGDWKIPYPESEFNYDAFIAYPDAFAPNWTSCYVPPEIEEVIETYLWVCVPNHFNNVMDYKDALRLCEQACNERWSEIFE